MSGQPTSATLTAGRVMSPMQMAYEFGILKQQFLQLLNMLGIDQNGTMPEWIERARRQTELPPIVSGGKFPEGSEKITAIGVLQPDGTYRVMEGNVIPQEAHNKPGSTKPRKG